jgi:Na+-transporting methylmalonyl-CoA/oxaloacetate decarboxylase gamma subunit
LDQPALWMLSISAFTAVMLLLGILAVAIRLLTLVFAPPTGTPAIAGAAAATAAAATAAAASSDAVDPHVLAAIHAAVQQRLPGGRVTHVAALPHEAPRGESAR